MYSQSPETMDIVIFKITYKGFSGKNVHCLKFLIHIFFHQYILAEETNKHAHTPQKELLFVSDFFLV